MQGDNVGTVGASIAGGVIGGILGGPTGAAQGAAAGAGFWNQPAGQISADPSKITNPELRNILHLNPLTGPGSAGYVAPIDISPTWQTASDTASQRQTLRGDNGTSNTLGTFNNTPNSQVNPQTIINSLKAGK